MSLWNISRVKWSYHDRIKFFVPQSQFSVTFRYTTDTFSKENILHQKFNKCMRVCPIYLQRSEGHTSPNVHGMEEKRER